MKLIWRSLAATSLFIVLAGFGFPAIVWVLGQTFFSHQANGSMITGQNGTMVGSELIGQSFTSEKYFHPRPSAAGSGYDGANSSGTNLGPISSKLINGIADDPNTPTDESSLGVKQLAKKYREENSLDAAMVLPSDAVTRSGSGLDPDISPQNAALQIGRVAKARRLSVDTVQGIVLEHTKGRLLGIWGEPRVNVLLVNLKLDELSKR